ncbi:hypothetical protein CONPUDRAFT_144307 [Coniophora puteana RWD-64-598 SS2]|uniref:Uncharacterized protein n=1 Tax=Coniophora puteana (strain RWD-64-598) TaxID=741705 RepID=A0A5M3MSG1_CONPW|nr:uncharacterized protein CONPUDRAFT_144307 [Coniophora puteana RWD-64-598 SS2]EIW81605.1 hypothetical protein CONPUDRAFT_144307 [Coniophora puteana RWD-64-598 SS2]
MVIWNTRRWRYIHGLFLVVRYLPLVCCLTAIIYALMSLDYFQCVQIYKGSGALLIIIMIATEGLLCLRTVALWYNKRAVKFLLVVLYLNAKSQSAAVQEEHILAGSFSAVAFFEFVVVCLTLIHGLATSGFKPSNRLLTSLREGNLLFQAVLHGVMASRIILSLQNADSVTGGERLQESVLLRSFAPMQFAPSPDPENAMTSMQSEHFSSLYTEGYTALLGI